MKDQSGPKNPPANPNPSERKGRQKRVVGHRLVPMSADQVDEVARREGRGQNANVRLNESRCAFCFLKGATTPVPGKKSDHFCRWNIGTRPPAEPARPIRQVPIEEWDSD